MGRSKARQLGPTRAWFITKAFICVPARPVRSAGRGPQSRYDVSAQHGTTGGGLARHDGLVGAHLAHLAHLHDLIHIHLPSIHYLPLGSYSLPSTCCLSPPTNIALSPSAIASSRSSCAASSPSSVVAHYSVLIPVTGVLCQLASRRDPSSPTVGTTPPLRSMMQQLLPGLPPLMTVAGRHEGLRLAVPA